MKLPDVRKLAKGQDCMFEIVGHCCHDPATVVFCHDRKHSGGGMGYKGADVGAFGCHVCHDIVDGRTKIDCAPDTIDWYWRRAHVRMWLFYMDYLESDGGE